MMRMAWRLLGKASAFRADADFLRITSQLSATGSRSQSCAHTLAYTRICSHPYSRAHMLIVVLIFVLVLILILAFTILLTYLGTDQMILSLDFSWEVSISCAIVPLPKAGLRL